MIIVECLSTVDRGRETVVEFFITSRESELNASAAWTENLLHTIKIIFGQLHVFCTREVCTGKVDGKQSGRWSSANLEYDWKIICMVKKNPAQQVKNALQIVGIHISLSTIEKTSQP